MSRGFTVEFTVLAADSAPPDRVRHSGPDAEDSDCFATTLAGAILAVRELERVWGNGEEFGGFDTAEAAARLLLILAERELRPGGWWHFESDAYADANGYAAKLAKLRAALDAARAFVAAVTPGPTGA